MSLHRRLASQSTIIFGARLVGAGLIFLVQALIARFWGAGAAGRISARHRHGEPDRRGDAAGLSHRRHLFRRRVSRPGRAPAASRLHHPRLWPRRGCACCSCCCGQPLLALFGQGEALLAAHFVPAACSPSRRPWSMSTARCWSGLKRPFAGFFADTMFRPMIVMRAFLATMALRRAGRRLRRHALDHRARLCRRRRWSHFGFVVTSLDRIPDTVPRARATKSRRWWRFALPGC